MKENIVKMNQVTKIYKGVVAVNQVNMTIKKGDIYGLDPIGIADMRETLKRLNEEHNITILISSYILTELSLVATRYSIIDKGSLIKELTAKELQEQSHGASLEEYFISIIKEGK